MSYATRQDLLDRFGSAELLQLTDRNGDGLEDDGVIDRALTDARDEVDAYLGARYALPLASVPAVLVRVSCDIARYRLWDDRASDEVRTRYTDAVRLLERISKGDVSLGLEPALTPAGEIKGGQVLADGNPERLFGRNRGH